MNLFIAGTDIAGVLISLVILFAILSTGEKKKKKNKYLILGIGSIVIFAAADGISFIMDEFGGNDVVHFYGNLMSYIGADFIITAFGYYISERIREKFDFPKIYARAILIGSVLDMGFILIGAYTGGLFQIENGKTVYGELNNYLGLLQLVVSVFFLIGIAINSKSLDRKFVITIYLYFLFPLIAMITVLVDERLVFSYLAAVLAFLIMFVIVVQEDLHASIIGERIMREASITDVLTGLLNRKAYTDDIEKFNYPYPNDFVYLSLDLNGLKNINDHLGHAAGDESIQGAAQCMTKCLGPYGKVYRTGGDEFTAILQIPSGQLQTVLAEFEAEVSNWHGKSVDSIAISYGYVKAEEMEEGSMNKVSAIADKRMYEAKANYYKKKGIDRRGQIAANTALCNLYTKVLKINLTTDTYSIINMDVSEQTAEKGFADNISGWLQKFGKSGQVHRDDLDDYLKKTDIEYLKQYFRNGKTSITISYRRKYDDGFKQAAMEIIPADDYTTDHQALFLYVKNVDR